MKHLYVYCNECIIESTKNAIQKTYDDIPFTWIQYEVYPFELNLKSDNGPYVIVVNEQDGCISVKADPKDNITCTINTTLPVPILVIKDQPKKAQAEVPSTILKIIGSDTDNGFVKAASEMLETACKVTMNCNENPQLIVYFVVQSGFRLHDDCFDHNFKNVVAKYGTGMSCF